MDGHLRAWRTHRVLAWIYAIGLVAFFGLQQFRPELLPSSLNFAGSVLPVLFLVHLLAARGSRLRQPWARFLSLLTGAVLVLVFPVGTVFGYFLLTGAWRQWPEARAHAGAPRGGWPKAAGVDRRREERRSGDRRGGMR